MEPLNPNADAARGSLAIVQACAAEFAGRAQTLKHEPTADTLHDYRISLRRLRVALGHYLAVSDKPLQPALRDQLKALSQQSGIARNWHVFIDKAIDVIAQEPSSVPVTELRRQAWQLAEQALQACVDEVSQPGFMHLIESLRELDTDEARAMIGEADAKLRAYALKRLRKQHRRARKLWRKRTTLSDDELHELRKRFKKLRYTADFFGSLFDGQAMARYVKRLKRIQAQLGYLHDQSVARQLARDPHLVHADPTAAALVEGWVMSSQHCERERLATLKLGNKLRPWK